MTNRKQIIQKTSLLVNYVINYFNFFVTGFQKFRPMRFKLKKKIMKRYLKLILFFNFLF